MNPFLATKFITYDEIQHFYFYYEDILAETRTTVARPYDEIIFKLEDDEFHMDRQLQNGIAEKTRDVDSNIRELKDKSLTAGNFFIRAGYRLQYWIAIALRNHHIQHPFVRLSRDLNDVGFRKIQQIHNRDSVIQKECDNLAQAYDFLKKNKTYLFGAEGEETVIKVLNRLPDDYHVLNDIILRFSPPLFWVKTGRKVWSCQIDHIIAGPTGFFVLETKNCTTSNFKNNLDRIRLQVNRIGFALREYIRDNYYSWILDGPQLSFVVVSLKEINLDGNFGGDIDIITPDGLCDYIMKMKATVSTDAVEKFINIVYYQKNNAQVFTRIIRNINFEYIII